MVETIPPAQENLPNTRRFGLRSLITLFRFVGGKKKHQNEDNGRDVEPGSANGHLKSNNLGESQLATSDVETDACVEASSDVICSGGQGQYQLVKDATQMEESSSEVCASYASDEEAERRVPLLTADDQTTFDPSFRQATYNMRKSKSREIYTDRDFTGRRKPRMRNFSIDSSISLIPASHHKETGNDPLPHPSGGELRSVPEVESTTGQERLSPTESPPLPTTRHERLEQNYLTPEPLHFSPIPNSFKKGSRSFQETTFDNLRSAEDSGSVRTPYPPGSEPATVPVTLIGQSSEEAAPLASPDCDGCSCGHRSVDRSYSASSSWLEDAVAPASCLHGPAKCASCGHCSTRQFVSDDDISSPFSRNYRKKNSLPHTGRAATANIFMSRLF